jgi:hypothetical protein
MSAPWPPNNQDARPAHLVWRPVGSPRRRGSIGALWVLAVALQLFPQSCPDRCGHGPVVRDTWGNIINTREEIHAMLSRQGLRIVDETSLSRSSILTAQRRA